MGLEGAVRLGYRRELDATRTRRAPGAVRRMVARPTNGARRSAWRVLEIDDVIDPAETRAAIVNYLARARAPGWQPAFAWTGTRSSLVP